MVLTPTLIACDEHHYSSNGKSASVTEYATIFYVRAEKNDNNARPHSFPAHPCRSLALRNRHCPAAAEHLHERHKLVPRANRQDCVVRPGVARRTRDADLDLVGGSAFMRACAVIPVRAITPLRADTAHGGAMLGES